MLDIEVRIIMQDLLQKRGTKYTARKVCIPLCCSVHCRHPPLISPPSSAVLIILIYTALSVICLPKKYFKHINLLYQFSSKMF